MDTQVEVIGIVKDIQSQLESLPSQPVIGTIPVEITSAQIVVGGDGDDDIVGGSSEDILVGDLGGVQTYTEAGKNYNIAMLIDLSGSMAGTIKYNGKNMTYAQMVQEVLKHFSSILAKHDGLINFKIMTFSSSRGLVKSLLQLPEPSHQEELTIMKPLNRQLTGLIAQISKVQAMKTRLILLRMVIQQTTYKIIKQTLQN